MSNNFHVEHDKDARWWGYPSYRVIHTATGLRVTSRYTRSKAEAVIAWLESLPGGWDFKKRDSKRAEAAIAAAMARKNEVPR